MLESKKLTRDNFNTFNNDFYGSMKFNKIDAVFVDQLVQIVGSDNCFLDPEILAKYGHDETEDFVWGKTGTLKNNHNYSGYIITNKGRQYVFSIMINHFTDDIDIIKEAISDFLKYIKSSA